MYSWGSSDNVTLPEEILNYKKGVTYFFDNQLTN